MNVVHDQSFPPKFTCRNFSHQCDGQRCGFRELESELWLNQWISLLIDSQLSGLVGKLGLLWGRASLRWKVCHSNFSLATLYASPSRPGHRQWAVSIAALTYVFTKDQKAPAAGTWTEPLKKTQVNVNCFLFKLLFLRILSQWWER